MTKILGLTAALIAGLASGAGAPLSRSDGAQQVVSPQTATEENAPLCAGGAKDPGLHLHLEAGSNGQVSIVGANELAEDMKARVGIELINDEGEEFMAPELSKSVRLPGKKEKQLKTFELPEGLPDGYYQVRVTGAGVTKQGVGRTTETARYYRVTNAVAEAVDLATFAAESQDNAEKTSLERGLE